MFEKDYKLACDIIESKIDMRYLTNYFSKLYFFTNENFEEILKNVFNSSGKSLIVGSSNDQAFNLINHGAKSITVCDLNPFSKYYFALKKAALISLKVEKYLDYFFVKKNKYSLNKNSTFNYDIFKIIADNLDDETRLFWNLLYEKYESSTIIKNLFVNDILERKSIILNNGYLDPKNYSSMKGNFENLDINFIKGEIVNYAKNNSNLKYDFIYLSNVFDYMFNILVKGKDEIRSILPDYLNYLNYFINILNENGVLVFHYFWNNDDNEIYPIIYDYISKFIKIDNILLRSANHFPNETDSVLVYRKKLETKKKM